MATSVGNLAFFFALAGIAILAFGAHELPSDRKISDIEARLSGGLWMGSNDEGGGGGGGFMDCWNSLMEIKSCTNEIVLFFINGESYLSLDCCRAIRVITHHCWPSMLASLGFTAEEGDILRGYCDAETDGAAAAPTVILLPPPPPPASPAVASTD